MTDEQIQDAAEDHKAIEIHKAINVTNAIAKAIEAGKRAAIVQDQDFDIPDCEYDYYDEEGQGSTRRF